MSTVSTTLEFGSVALRTRPHALLGLIIDGEVGSDGLSHYLDPILDSAAQREAFFALVEREGMVVCKNLLIDESPYKRVGGKRTHGRISQGEYFHHDGCSTPEKPRMLEIRCPPQRVVRSMLTSTAWFPEVVIAMLEELPPDLRRAGELGRWCSTIEAGRTPEEDWDVIQGVVNRTVRLLPPERTRGYFRDVDHRLEAYLEPWTMGESRFMANGASRSVQHRRACHPPWRPGTPNGHLLKRWPAEELPPPAAL